jgi:hypothetical protein
LPGGVLTGSRLTIELAYAGRLAPQSIDQEGLGVRGQTQGRGQQPPQNPDEPRLLIVPEQRWLYSSRSPWHPQAMTHDYATAELRVTVPAEYQIAAVGRQVGSSATQALEAGKFRDMMTSQYVADRPVRYLSCLISRFGVVSRAIADVPGVAAAVGSALTPGRSVGIEVLATPRMMNRNKTTADLAARVVRFLSETVGEAPYPSLSIIALDDNVPGGHSPAYFVALHQALPSTPYSWANDPAAFENAYPPFFLAHEIAHQWWGQAVGWRNYHEQWLSEGLAQYFAVLYAGADRGPQMIDTLIATMRQSSRQALNQGPIALGYRIGHVMNDGRAFRHIVYNKAAVVLHMLRRFIGDDAFFSGLRRFYAERRFTKAGTVHLRQAFEATAGIDLTRFFEQWIYGFGVPRLRVSSAMDADGLTAVIKVEQPAHPFDLPLTVSLQFADGRTELRTLRVTGAVFEERFTTTSPLRRATIRDDLSYFERF